MNLQSAMRIDASMIGIMGGTFDPVHFGHLRTAIEVRETFELDEIRLVPCRQPPHRSQPVAPPELRRTMLERAIGDEPGFLIDARELDRSGPSYTVDTLRSMRAEFPNVRLGLILGIDAFSGLQSWHRWRNLPKLTHFIVLHRPGYPTRIPEGLSQAGLFRFAQCVDELKSNEAGCVYFLKLSQLEISSSTIREIIGSKRNPRFLLPELVLEVIREQRLYR